MDLFCHLQSLVISIASTLLKIDAANCQWLNVDPISWEKVVFQKKSRGDIGFHKKVRENFLLVQSQGNFVRMSI